MKVKDDNYLAIHIFTVILFFLIPDPKNLSEPVVIWPPKNKICGKFTFYFNFFGGGASLLLQKNFMVRNPTNQKNARLNHSRIYVGLGG